MAMKVPERIGKYAISAVLGQGAMGVVYKGFDPHIHRPVAIKTIHRELLGDDDVHASIAARFRNEAQAVGRLQHPGIVAIYEFGEDENTAYIAMEFVEGKNLDQILAATPQLPEGQARRIMEQVLDALECAHRAGVWHRDIKPANLLLTASGQVKLTDFGIARIEHQGLTQVASMIGTPGFMAPEQYIGEGIDHRADLFAAGVVLYRLLTGVQPFTGAAETVMYKIMNEHPKPPSQVSATPLSGAYDGVINRALAKKAENRFQSAQAFRQALLASATQAAVPENNDATVIVPPSHWARTVEAAVAPPPASPSGARPTTFAPTSMSTAMLPTGWEAEALSRIERLLAPHVGPMAKLMVRQAAHKNQEVVGLAMELSQHIGQETQRQRFISEALAGSQALPRSGTQAIAGTGASGARPAAGTGSGSSAAAAEPVTEAIKAHAATVLTRHLGPIAKIVVKRAADKATSKAQLYQLLLEAASEVDPAKLLNDLQAM
ncbi:MAG: serine/threonine protein kinase [Burkholderiaceae bacterium]|nr:serine/threonine protein kinase [Burkholderiaceae bacterium]